MSTLGAVAATGGMRFSIDPWDPSYGTSVADDGFKESTAKIEAGVEEAPSAWRPVPLPAARGRLVAAPDAVLFVDGVRREDARGWIDDLAPADTRATSAAPAVCASFASGVVCSCALGAHLLTARVERGLFTPARHAGDITTLAGTYRVRPVTDDGPNGLNLAIQQAMTTLEISIAAGARHGHATVPGADGQVWPGPDGVAGSAPDDSFADGPAWPSDAEAQPVPGDPFAAGPTGPWPRQRLAEHPTDQPGGAAPDRSALLIVDGPLRGRTHMPRTLGFIKTHHSRYLEPPQHEVVGRLQPGERTPVFMMGTNWDRFTWYLRLPSRPGAPWAGVARIECPASLPAADAIGLADLSQVVLPRFASHEFKDGRAPQNLYPIAGLERALRRRLGDRQLMYRSLRRAAGGAIG
ncbi:hypothetical protein I6A60_39475 [Frankia sp. AgB1.9]|uniref:hypothetical protein n=1 Tax=unclassified Frankia TaxID=2632575 RepID=UPI001931DDE0|nr:MULTISPECIES: hypothetical protein [unclassified Frankia]MBL7490589.1 hypothetical protein [Frankia sp. AgW1.1]MBL7553866.1 hypothetical protein [Frankia sp. AgB1.9]MBL7617980.1 hypothetical protein [Frankia sp. AgB1.8]